ncbi:MAG: hypothetical protein K8W52_31010, partial [Deltaproteobacteria bacterium]|nr:hypothetical protein [Deltaproteobacteria bacterium]
MVERVVGAPVALVAAVLLVLGAVVAPWWAGHPEIGGVPNAGQMLTVTLRDAELCIETHEATGRPRCGTAGAGSDCDDSSKETCKVRSTGAMSPAFGAAGWATLVLGLVTALLLVITAFAAFAGRARGVALAAGILATVVGVTTAVFVFAHPDLRGVDMGGAPIAMGGGVLSAWISAWWIRRPARAPRESRAPMPSRDARPSRLPAPRAPIAPVAVPVDLDAAFAALDDDAPPSGQPPLDMSAFEPPPAVAKPAPKPALDLSAFEAPSKPIAKPLDMSAFDVPPKPAKPARPASFDLSAFDTPPPVAVKPAPAPAAAPPVAAPPAPPAKPAVDLSAFEPRPEPRDARPDTERDPPAQDDLPPLP